MYKYGNILKQNYKGNKMLLDRVISSSYSVEDKKQFCFMCPEALKKDFEEVAKSYGKTLTTLMLGAMNVMVQEFKGGDMSQLTTAEARVYFEIEKLEEKLEPYLIDNDHDEGYEMRGYIFNDDSKEYTYKINNLLERIERLKSMIKEK